MSDRFQWNFRFEILFAADHASGPKEKYITKKKDRGEEVKDLSKTEIENKNESATTKKRGEAFHTLVRGHGQGSVRHQ